MANNLGRISGQLLKENLTRNGNDLVFDDLGTPDPVLKLNVTNRYVSINSDVTSRDLFVNSVAQTTNLISVDRLNRTSDTFPLKLSISGNTIVSRDTFNFYAATQVNANIIDTDNIRINNNAITTKTLNTDLELRPAGSLEVHNFLNITGNSVVISNNLDIDGNFAIGGIITVGNAFVDDIVDFEAPVELDLRPISDNIYSLGAPTNKRWNTGYLDASYIGSYKLENAIISTVVTNADVELRANGTGKIFANQNNVEFDQNLTVTGTTALKNSVIGSAAIASSLSFSGSNYLSLSAAQTIGTQAFTFECFFYTASNGLQTILGASSSGGMSIWLFGDGVNPVTTIQIDRSYVDAAQYTVSAMAINTWHHIAVTRDSLNNMSVFLDGVKATGSASNTANYTGPSGLIGAVAGSSYFFTGYLTQIKLAVGSNYYDPTAASISVPTAVLTISANTKLLLIVANSVAYLIDTSGTQTISNIGGVIYSSTGPSTSNITHIGNYYQTGNTVQTGNRTITGTLDVTNNVYFDNIHIVDNRIFTTNSNDDLELTAAGSGIVKFRDNLRIVNSLTADTLTANGITNSGTVTSDIFTNNNINIVDNKISTTVTDANIILSSNGIGKVKTILTNVIIDQTLDVSDTTSLKNTSISGLLDITGDYTQSGTYTQTGNRDVSELLTITNNVYFDNINIVDNRIFTTNSNDNLELRAIGTGIVVFNDNTQFSQAALFGTLVTNGLTNSGIITSDLFTEGDIEINDNYITTTVGNNDLRLVPNGVGKVSMPLDPVAITQALTVEDTAILKNVAINGNITHLGNTTQTGNVVQTGNFNLSTDLTVTGTDAFFTDIRIVNNRIATSTGNNNLELRANGTAIIKIADSATFGQTLTVNGITTTSTISATTGTITSDIFTDGDIEINDNYITTTVGNNNLILAGNTTGSPKLEKIKFNSNTISTDTVNEGIILTIPFINISGPLPATELVLETGGFILFEDGSYISSEDPGLGGNLVINTNNALKVPVGSTVDRPTLTQAEFRFNSTDNLFRGYSTATVSFGGVYSADIRTSVVAHPTNNTLLFTTNNVNNMTVSATGLTVNSLSVDNNTTLATNIISTAVTNSDLYLTPNGTGKVVLDDISLQGNNLTNAANAALVIQNTGAGYVKFGGTNAIALPAGPTVVDTTGIEIGDLRYNTDLTLPEIFNGIQYVVFGSNDTASLSGAEVEEITNLMALVLG